FQFGILCLCPLRDWLLTGYMWAVVAIFHLENVFSHEDIDYEILVALQSTSDSYMFFYTQTVSSHSRSSKGWLNHRNGGV
nr:hypothetical protein [Tanacetum cinerariifolium]